jgi:hypothetical protein
MSSLKPLLALGFAAACVPSAHAGLVGTSLTLSLLGQITSSSPAFKSSFPKSALVSDSSVEFADVHSLFNDGDPKPPGWTYIVNTAIDASDNALVIDFKHAGKGAFAPGYQNTYVFTFDSVIKTTLSSASIDTAVTTLGLSADDITIAGNQLFVNVEGLSFTTKSYVKINLGVVGGTSPVPEPADYGLLAAGVAMVGIAMRRRPGNKSR